METFARINKNVQKGIGYDVTNAAPRHHKFEIEAEWHVSRRSGSRQKVTRATSRKFPYLEGEVLFRLQAKPGS